MAAQGSLVMWRAVFAALGVLMVATLVYTSATDGSPFRPELLTPWMVATLIDFYVNVIAISAWVIYKEANWISSAVWVILLCCFGSAVTCAYIVKKLFEVTSAGSSQDPLDLLFIRQGNLSQRKCSYIVIGRVIFSILGIFMAAVVTYTVITDGLPFRKELLTPWMAATLIDFYINVFAISVWVTHKESSWISTTIWIVLLICFGSITTCGYIVLQLFKVSYQDPIYHVLLNSHSKITVEILATSVGVSEEEIRAHLTYMPCLLEVSDIADWVARYLLAPAETVSMILRQSFSADSLRNP